MEENKCISVEINDPNIVFQMANAEPPVLELKSNGEIFVRGELVETNKEVVEALKDFLRLNGYQIL